MTEKLQKARRFELEKGAAITAGERPAFHLTPQVGWMNDPNGFSYYEGKYHMYFQYYPYDTNWGPMHWGHGVSEDLLHWEYVPCAIAPDMDYDDVGCFSGSAITLPDGRQMLMYTGVTRGELPDGTPCDHQTQCLAFGDGVDFEKYEQNPVLTKEDLPEGASEVDFRDPKVWLGSDGIYRCAVGSRPADGSGQILIYTSEDAIHWSFKNVLVQNGNRIGKMWECPDFFQLDGKAILLTSPQDMEAVDLEYRSGNGSICLIGTYDEATDTFIEEADQAVDYGIDFYAHQTVETPDGRRVMIGWMQNWDTCCVREDGQKWYGQMSLPREISLRDGRLYQQPVKELEALRANPVTVSQVISDEEMIRFDGVNGRCTDLEITLSAADVEKGYDGFALRFAENDKYYSELKYSPKENILSIDRRHSGTKRAVVHQSECFVDDNKGELKLRVIIDRNSVEVFANDGKQVMTMTFYTDASADGISFAARGAVKVDVTKYDLKM